MSVDKDGKVVTRIPYEVGLNCTPPNYLNQKYEAEKVLAESAKLNHVKGMVPGLANNIQIAGNHYKKYGDLQPWDVVIKWNLGYLEGTALKYIARWRDKGGVEDIKKAIHFLQKLVETEEEKYGLRGDS